MSILGKINDHADLVSLNEEDQAKLCQELRDFLISHISQTGGHLASNLGVVELTVAIETVFDTNKDRLVFDVGHQSYVHKLLTGRQADFDSLRQLGGIAGFPKPSESISDAFIAGHASSSVSIALGMARARKLTGNDYRVVALVGDGAATGGMVYEALNDAGASKEPLIVILNDNEMSIDRNVGGFARHLAKLRMKDRYLGMKDSYRKALNKLPGGKGIYNITSRIKNWLKRVFLPETIFEHMGFDYLGPVDGHDLPELIRILRIAKDMHYPVLIHVLTQKGHGFAPAEVEPSRFHGIGKFDPETGETSSKGGKLFSAAFGEKLIELAEKDPRICAITAAMPGGTGLVEFKEKYPTRLFDVGIAEEHAVSMAGGLAKQGAIPIVALYSTFLQRAFDQMMQDISMLKLHAVFAVDRAGLVGEDGETHHGLFDIGFLRQAPGMKILAPISCLELQDMLQWAVMCQNGPVAIRYPRGGDRGYSDSDWDCSAAKCHRKGGDLTIITHGIITNHVLSAAEAVSKSGIEATVIRLMQVYPIDAESIHAHIVPEKPVLVIEEAAASAGIHEMIAALLVNYRPQMKLSWLDFGAEYVTHGSIDDLYHKHGLDVNAIAEKIMEVTRHEN